MTATPLSSISSRELLILGLAHVAFGIVKFGVPLILVGHVAVRASGCGDLALLRSIGGYVCATSLVGVAALPKSPFPGSLLVSVLLVVAGFGFWAVEMTPSPQFTRACFRHLACQRRSVSGLCVS